MHTDIVDLREFYASPLGQISSRSIVLALSTFWTKSSQERLLGFGYTTPVLDRFKVDAERAIAFMPAAQGAVNWPHGEPSATALVFEEDLPLPDSCIDRIVMMHSLEHAENPIETLREMWRILAPGGHLVIVVPNRRGVWARLEHTPFGTGRPYSRGQLIRLLRAAMFTPSGWSDALHFPPGKGRFSQRFATLFERLGRQFWPAFSGVVIVEATKKLYSGIPAAQQRSRRVFIPVLTPQGAARTIR